MVEREDFASARWARIWGCTCIFICTFITQAKQRKRHDIQQHARRHQARKLIMESTQWRNYVDLQWYMESLPQFAGYSDTPLKMSTRSYISSEEVFSSLNNSDSRPSNFLFQIARGSGATLSECTFFFEKAHVTKKTSSRQTTSRPHDKKNPDRSISEFFFIKNLGICSGALRRRIRVISRQDPPIPCSK